MLKITSLAGEFSGILLKEEQQTLIQMLDEIDPKANYLRTLEEEVIDLYDTTVRRIKAYQSEQYARNLIQEILRKR